jgi:hypothetical protein
MKGGLFCGWLRERWVFQFVLFGKFSVAWLMKLLDTLVRRPKLESSTEGNKAFIAQRGSNNFNRFLEVVEYAVDGHREIIIVLEGREWQGWRIVAAKLGKALHSWSAHSVQASLCSWWLLISLHRQRTVMYLWGAIQ